MTTSWIRTRYGVEADVTDVTALHARCSPEALHRRFHAPLLRVGPRMARQLLFPVTGWSLLAEQENRLSGMAVAGPLSPQDLELGLLVEDAHQGRGVGTRLLVDSAAQAVRRGYRRLHCLTQPDNAAVLGVIRKAGLSGVTTVSDGLLHVTMPLVAVEEPLPA